VADILPTEDVNFLAIQVALSSTSPASDRETVDALHHALVSWVQAGKPAVGEARAFIQGILGHEAPAASDTAVILLFSFFGLIQEAQTEA
jgi:hypothetical protein